MNIVYLAWGSLVWDPRNLPIERRWFDDGPFAPVEFTRQSNDGRLTLVLDAEAEPVRLLWARTTVSDVDEAMKALSEREGITSRDWKSRMGRWRTGEEAPEKISSLPMWAQARGIDAAVWTGLGPRYKRSNADTFTKERPPIGWVLDYLQRLTGPLRDFAERYVRCAPPQIDTEYRRQVEAMLGWTAQTCG